MINNCQMINKPGIIYLRNTVSFMVSMMSLNKFVYVSIYELFLGKCPWISSDSEWIRNTELEFLGLGKESGCGNCGSTLSIYALSCWPYKGIYLLGVFSDFQISLPKLLNFVDNLWNAWRLTCLRQVSRFRMVMIYFSSCLDLRESISLISFSETSLVSLTLSENFFLWYRWP